MRTQHDSSPKQQNQEDLGHTVKPKHPGNNQPLKYTFTRLIGNVHTPIGRITSNTPILMMGNINESESSGRFFYEGKYEVC